MPLLLDIGVQYSVKTVHVITEQKVKKCNFWTLAIDRMYIRSGCL